MGLFDRRENGQWRSSEERQKAKIRFVLAIGFFFLAVMMLLQAIQDGAITMAEAQQVLDTTVDGLENMVKSLGA